MQFSAQLKCPDFSQMNSLIFRRSTSHQISELKNPQKNIELKFIVMSKQPSFRTKKDTITQCQIADGTASITMNFFNDTGLLLEEGDIGYISGGYTSYYKGMIVMYEGQSIVRRIGRWHMKFDLKNNVSRDSIVQEEKGRTEQKELNFND